MKIKNKKEKKNEIYGKKQCIYMHLRPRRVSAT